MNRFALIPRRLRWRSGSLGMTRWGVLYGYPALLFRQQRAVLEPSAVDRSLRLTAAKAVPHTCEVGEKNEVWCVFVAAAR